MDGAFDNWEGLAQLVSVQQQPAEVEIAAILRLPSGFRLRRVTCSPEDPCLRRPRVRWLARAGQSRWALTPALFDPGLVGGRTTAGRLALEDLDFETLDEALQASRAGPTPLGRGHWADAKTFFDIVKRESRSGQGVGGGDGGDFGGGNGGDGGE
jgi:hypothetical protein